MRKFMPVISATNHAIGTKIAEIRKSECEFIVVQIPWGLLEGHESQAQINHSQSLERLAQRGGLSPCEALAIMEDRRYRKMDYSEANKILVRIIANSWAFGV